MNTTFPNWLRCSGALLALYYRNSEQSVVYVDRYGVPNVFDCSGDNLVSAAGVIAEAVQSETAIFEFMEFPEELTATISGVEATLLRIPALLPQSTHLSWPYHMADGTGPLYFAHHVAGGGFQIYEASIDDLRILVGTAA